MSTTEEPQKLYAAREPVFPKRVYGHFRNLKWAVLIITLGIYYITPWIRWDRGPALPDQGCCLIWPIGASFSSGSRFGRMSFTLSRVS